MRQWLAPAFGPAIPDDPGTMAHVYFNGSTLVDSKGNAWTQNGTVPQVRRSGRTPAGAGPFSDANYYSLGTGTDVLDFAGDFSICVVFVPAGTSASNPVLMTNGVSPGSGYEAAQWLAASNHMAIQFNNGAGNSVVDSGVVPLSSSLNVFCSGRTGANGVAKMNLATLVSGAAGAIVAGTTQSAALGTYPALAGLSWAGQLYEFWASTITPSDALFTSIMQTVKAKLAITAW